MIVKIGDGYYRAEAIVSIAPGTPWQATKWQETTTGNPGRWVGYGPVEPRVRVRLVSAQEFDIAADFATVLRAWQEALGAAKPPSEGAFR